VTVKLTTVFAILATIRIPVTDMTYNVFGGTLNLAQSVTIRILKQK